MSDDTTTKALCAPCGVGDAAPPAGRAPGAAGVGWLAALAGIVLAAASLARVSKAASTRPHLFLVKLEGCEACAAADGVARALEAQAPQLRIERIDGADPSLPPLKVPAIFRAGRDGTWYGEEGLGPWFDSPETLARWIADRP